MRNLLPSVALICGSMLPVGAAHPQSTATVPATCFIPVNAVPSLPRGRSQTQVTRRAVGSANSAMTAANQAPPRGPLTPVSPRLPKFHRSPAAGNGMTVLTHS